MESTDLDLANPHAVSCESPLAVIVSTSILVAVAALHLQPPQDLDVGDVRLAHINTNVINNPLSKCCRH